jgi:branched-chain amino acid transport system ATP-binding protein
VRSHRIRSLGIARTYQIPRPFMGMTIRENVAVSCLFGTERLSPSDRFIAEIVDDIFIPLVSTEPS